jgi:hypothetical protein
MSLCIYAFSSVIESPEEDSDFCAENEPGFEGREASLLYGKFYTGEHQIVCSLSHRQWNDWRQQLAVFAGYPKTVLPISSGLEALQNQVANNWPNLTSACLQSTPGPFLELLAFTDNYGVLGPLICTKLASDFLHFNTQAVQYASTLGTLGRDWLQIYQDLNHAFLSVFNGAVVFR